MILGLQDQKSGFQELQDHELALCRKIQWILFLVHKVFFGGGRLMPRSLDVVSLFSGSLSSWMLFEKKITEACGYSFFQEMLMNKDLWRLL